MPLPTLDFPPGLTTIDSAYGSKGRWIEGSNVRFVAGRPEKIGGWAKAINATVPEYGRSLHAWMDSANRRQIAQGSYKELAVILDGEVQDITPFEAAAQGTLTNPLTTTNGDVTVGVAHTGHGQATGDMVVLSAASAVGGLIILGSYKLTRVDADHYTIDAALPASSTAGPGGGAVLYQYFRGLLGADPITTESGSTTVTIAHAGHGRGVGDRVEFTGATAVGGLTLAGAFEVTTVAADSYTVTAGSAASSSATGGGSAVTYRYNVSIGLVDQSVGYGYGIGGYGLGPYGTARDEGQTRLPRVWSLDNRFDLLIASYRGGAIYQWLYGDSHATPILNAPQNNSFTFVTAAGFIVAVGAGGNLRRVEASDNEDITIWTPAADNSAYGDSVANETELVGFSKLNNNTTLLGGASRCFLLQYTGDDYVFDLRDVGGKSGPISLKALAEFNGVPYWMGLADFFMFNGAIQPLPSNDIQTRVFRDINLDQRGKFFAGVNVDHNEIWWFYCSAGATEIDRWVAYDMDDQCWTYGAMSRFAWLDPSVFSKPLCTGASSGSHYLYQHETGVDDDGAALGASIRSAPADLEDGALLMDINAIIPDFKRLTGTMEVTVYSRDKPNSAEESDGPHTVTSATEEINPRASGRQIAIGLELLATVGADFRLGATRIDYEPAGRRA